MLDKFSKFLPQKFRSGSNTVPVVRLQGPIGMATPLRPGLSLAGVTKQLDKAFGMKKAPAVALVINSPGGSPVQSRLIYQRIRDLAIEKEKEVFVFVEDVAASGGYMIALAGDHIIADTCSILGSIGVVSAGFGFPDLLKKIGVERRVYTAGENKVILDPFQKENPAEVEYLKGLQQDIHEVFVDMVKERRGDVLADDAEIFSGRFWAGNQSQSLGLIDEIGDIQGVLKKRFGKDTELRLIPAPRDFLGRRNAAGGIFAAASGNLRASSVGDELISTVEERGLWNRYGL